MTGHLFLKGPIDDEARLGNKVHRSETVRYHMIVSTSVRDDTAEIRLQGRFDYSSRREFEIGFQTVLANDAVKAIRIDTGHVSYMDSTALGMLLKLRIHVQSAGKAVSLAGAKGQVKQILKMANFEKLFSIT